MSDRTRRTSGILQVPVMMDIQSLTQQDYTGLTKEERKKALSQLRLVMQMVDPKGKVPMGSDIVYIPKTKIACIDLTTFYEDEEHPEDTADLSSFVDMFTDGYTEDAYGNIETTEEDEILAVNDYEGESDSEKYDIDRCLTIAKKNVKKLQDMIEAIEHAKAQGATRFAAIDFNDYDGDTDDDDD